MSTRRERLLLFLRKLLPLHLSNIQAEAKRGWEDLTHPEWLWRLLSMSTYGRASGYSKMHARLDELSFDKLTRMTEQKRRDKFRTVIKEVNPRYSERKVETLERALQRIQEMGGPIAAKEKALMCAGGIEKVRFLRKFYGLGPKYARNIWMDAADPDVANAAALDSRLMGVLVAVTSDVPKTYEKQEAWYQQLAADLGVNTWTLDRLVFRTKDEILAHLDQRDMR